MAVRAGEATGPVTAETTRPGPEAAPHSLVRRTLVRIAVRMAVVVALASAVGYWHVERSVQRQAEEALGRYMAERQAREGSAFEELGRSLDYLALRLERALSSGRADPRFRFQMVFAPDDDGTLRVRESLFEHDDITGFVGKNVSLDAERRGVLVAAADLLRELGPSYIGRFANAYVVTPDHAVVMFWPDEPWAHDSADWEIFGKMLLATPPGERGILVSGAPSPGGDRAALWSNVYFDYGANRWMVSARQPVTRDGRTLAFVGHDLLLDDLFERVLEGGQPGTETVLLAEDGTLIAHPRYMEAIEAHGGNLNVAEVDAPELQRLHAAARAAVPGEVVRLEDRDALLAVARLPGPDWFLLTVVPERLVRLEARTVGCLILLGGLFALLVELLILWSTLKHQVGRPLASLAAAARQVGAGNFRVQLVGTDRPDELGDLARAFAGMTVELDKRRRTLGQRNQELARLADQLAEELESRKRAEAELARHRELNVLLESIEYGVMFLDGDLNIRLANRAYRALWHVPPDFYDRPRNLKEDMDFSQSIGLYGLGADEWARYRDARIAEVRAGEAGPTELALSDGTVMQYRVHALPDGGRMLTYFDLTAVVQADELLREHRAGMEASMDGMALLDDTGRFVYVNRAHAAIYGFDDPAGMVGLSWHVLYAADELARFEREIMPELFKALAWRGEAVGRRRDGEAFPQELSLGITPSGGIVCVVRDITSRREREEALAEALGKAEEASAAKSRFLASMSHELRTPLNAIIGFARIVQRKTEGEIAPLQTENLSKILASGEHLLHLINEILDLARIEAGHLDLRIAPYAPAAVADETVRTVEPMVKPGVRLFRTGLAADVMGLSDADKVRQILLNLVGNAAKFTEAGEIRVDVSASGDDVAFTVADTGPGIPPAQHERIFEEFARAGRGAGAREGSTGLGLSISRRLARLLGGDVTVTSAPGAGSTFRLVIPKAAAAGRGAPPARADATTPS